jgi:hypothetical protein
MNYERKRLTKETDRGTFLAIKGKPITLKATAVENAVNQKKWPEKEELLQERSGNLRAASSLDMR